MERFPVLETERLVLREITPLDREDLFVFRGDPEQQLYNGGAIDSLEGIDSLIDNLSASFHAGTALHWGLTIREHGDSVVGLFGYSHIAAEHKRSETGYDLARPFWGRGFAFEAMGSILAYGFHELELNRIYAVPRIDNASSIRLLTRLGFRLEGICRDEIFVDGKFRDEGMFALLKREFEKGNSMS